MKILNKSLSEGKCERYRKIHLNKTDAVNIFQFLQWWMKSLYAAFCSHYKSKFQSLKIKWEKHGLNHNKMPFWAGNYDNACLWNQHRGMFKDEQRWIAACCSIVTTCFNKMAAERARAEDWELPAPVLCCSTATDALRGFEVNQLNSFSQH